MRPIARPATLQGLQLLAGDKGSLALVALMALVQARVVLMALMALSQSL